MKRKGHLGLSLILFSPLIYVGFKRGSVAMLLVLSNVVWLTPLPDYDFRMPFVKHRGFTHTIWFALIIGSLLSFVVAEGTSLLASNYPAVNSVDMWGEMSSIAFITGFGSVSSHILGDMFTPMGVNPFYPFTKSSISFNVARFDNPYLNTIFYAGGFVAIQVAVYYAVVGSLPIDIIEKVPDILGNLPI